METSPQKSGPEASTDLSIRASAEITALLEELRDKGIAVNLTSPSVPLITTQLWTVDASTGTVSFKMDGDHPMLEALIDSDEATAVAYLDSVKIQFDLEDLMLVRSTQGCALHCRFPSEMFRFQRRSSFRVQPLSRTIPKAFLRHPMIAEMKLELRVLDISMTGCALFLPHNLPPMDAGIQLNDVRFLLDTNTRFAANLHLHHITALTQHQDGVRLGCEIIQLTADGVRGLQRYIDQNQKLRRMQAKC